MRFFLIACALLLAACQPAPRLHTQESYVFGTRVEILIWGEPEDKARAAAAEALHEFDRLHRAYHAWQPSELTAANEAFAAARGIEVSAELAQLVREAQAFSARGDHLFDPGIGRLVALWGFHDEAFAARLPDPAQLAALVAAKPSIADVRIEGTRLASSKRTVALDFGGFLKGVALDRAAAVLKRHGVRNALINIGGNVMALGSKGGQPWRVGIQHPREPRPLASLELRDGEAIGTSGDYQRYFELDGRRYCHLIDPRDGRPACGRPGEGTQAVTILIPPRPDAGTWSDWASKPIFLAGEDWRAMAGRLGLDHVLRIDAAGAVVMTPEMQRRVKEQPAIR